VNGRNAQIAVIRRWHIANGCSRPIAGIRDQGITRQRVKRRGRFSSIPYVAPFRWQIERQQGRFVGPIAHDEEVIECTWLDDIKLSECFEVLELIDYGSLTKEDRHMVYSLFAIGRARSNLQLLSEKPASGYSISWLKDHNIPRYLLHLRAHVGSEWLKDFEKKFSDEQGVSFWQRVIEKVSLTTGISAHEIAAYAPVPCFGDIVAEVSGSFDRILHSGCLGPSAGVDLPFDFRPRVMVAQDRQVDSLQDDFPTAIGRYLLATFGATANISYLTREDSYVQAIIRGLKGRVIHGGRYWERVDISFALLQSGASARVRVLTDGVLAAGVGDYPPDSQFTLNMEPEYAEPLTEFNAQMADGLRDFLSRSDHQ